MVCKDHGDLQGHKVQGARKAPAAFEALREWRAPQVPLARPAPRSLGS